MTHRTAAPPGAPVPPRWAETAHTPSTFRLAHGDPAGWCSAEVDEYLDACDRSKDTVQRLERAAGAAQAGATAPQIVAAFTGEPGGGQR